MPAQEEKLVQRQAKIWIDWLHKVFLVWLSTLGLPWLTCYKTDFSESLNLPIREMCPSQNICLHHSTPKKAGAHIIYSNFSTPCRFSLAPPRWKKRLPNSTKKRAHMIGKFTLWGGAGPNNCEICARRMRKSGSGSRAVCPRGRWGLLSPPPPPKTSSP